MKNLSPQERSRADRNRNKRCAALNSVTESEYHTADDREDVLNVHILPARPINHEAEYAGRDTLIMHTCTAQFSSLASVPVVSRFEREFN